MRLDILDFLRRISREEQTSIILSSHISDDLDQIADSVLMIAAGKVLEYASASSLTHKYGQQRMEKIFVTAVSNQRHP